MTDGRIESLEDIWPLQAALNRKAGIDTEALGRALLSALSAGGGQADQATRVKVGRAMKNHIDALADECHEIQNCLTWKHWYREAKEGRQYELRDVQNARVEAIDMLFFWVSICQLLGLSPEDIYRLYGAKLGINHARQDTNRSQAEHAGHEEENRSVV
jgi:hypothetical protein